jgi:predicted ATPase
MGYPRSNALQQLTLFMIKRIKIRDFKSIRELDMDLDPVTVIVGRSGTGKSNTVQALRFLRNCVLGGQDNAVNYELGWGQIVPEGEKRPKTSIEVTFRLPGESKDYVYAISFGCVGSSQFPNQLILRSESLSLGGETIFSRSCDDGSRWTWQKAPEIANPPLIEPGPIINKLPSLQTVAFAYAGLSTGIGYYHFPASTLTNLALADPRSQFLQTVPGLWDNANNYLSMMRSITQDFHHPNIRKSLLASLKAVNPSLASIELDSLTSPNKAIVSHNAAGGIFALDLQQESDGFRRFYAHLLALYQNPSKLTLIFEEPENAIYPGALSLLADEFKAAPSENRGQVIITTHNPTLLDSFNVDDVRVVEMRDGKTVIGHVSKEQTASVKDQLLTTGDLLKIDQPRLDDLELAKQTL